MSFYRVESMSFSYPGSPLLFDDVSFEVNRGERVGFFGPNGSGKTTMAKLMLGILRPSRGSIFLGDKSIHEMSLTQVGQRVGFVFQNPDKQLFAPTVWEQVAFGLRLQGLDEHHIEDRVAYWLDYFDLINFKDRFPFYLSRGQKQRLVLAQVLAKGAEFLFMDEPTTGLDILRINKLSECLKALKSQNIGFIIISHERDFLKSHTERLIYFTQDGVKIP